MKKITSYIYPAICISLTSLSSYGSILAFCIQFFIEPIFSYLYFILFGMQLSASSMSLLVGILTLSSWLSAMQCSANIIVQDRFAKTIFMYLISQNRAMVFFLIRYITITVICFMSSLVTSVIVLYIAAADVLALLVPLCISLILASLGGAIFGVFSSVIGLLLTDGFAVLNLLSISIPILSGAVIPLYLFPNPLISICKCIPISWIVESVGLFLSFNTSDAFLLCGYALFLELLWILITLAFISFCNNRQRITGQIEGMHL